MTVPPTAAALITGAGSGIGAAVAVRLARRGVRVALLGRTESRLEATAREIRQSQSADVIVIAAHQEQESDVNRAADAVTEAFGGIDILVNNAAIYEAGTVAETSTDSWDHILEVNLRGPFLLTRRFLPQMRERGGGVIINVASTLAERPLAGYAAYSTSKAALLALTRCVALEEATHGIRSVAICPGVVDTPIHGTEEERREAMHRMAAFHPLGRVGTADEVARWIDRLASADASWITGTVFTIDGGVSL